MQGSAFAFERRYGFSLNIQISLSDTRKKINWGHQKQLLGVGISRHHGDLLICAFAFELRYVHKANIQISLKKASTKRMDFGLRVRPYVSMRDRD